MYYFTMTEKASVLISIDAELIWGFHDHKIIPSKRVKNARKSWIFLLDLFDKYDIPATWAVVGHLFLKNCDGVHLDHPAGESWFFRDPGTGCGSDSDWFARDLIEETIESKVNHEICSHSFSHVEFGKEETTPEIAEAELKYSIDVSGDYDLRPTSFVFPRNNIGYRQLLSDHGFLCYRGMSPQRWYDKTLYRRAGKLITFIFSTSGPPIVTPKVDCKGLVNIPASMYLFTFEGIPNKVSKTISSDPVVKQVKIGLEELRDSSNGILHLWLHPNNITTIEDKNRMQEILSLIAMYRDNYNIEVETMAEIADRIKTNE